MKNIILELLIYKIFIMKKLIRNQLKEIHGGKGICRPSAGFNCENGFICCARFQGYSGLCYAIGDEPAECWLP